MWKREIPLTSASLSAQLAVLYNMRDYFAGTVGGAVGILISHPVDTLRIRYQSAPGKPLNFLGLYKGVAPPLVGMMLEKSIVFGVYSSVKQHTSSHFLAGISAGIACTTIVTPIEKIKINLQNGIPFKNMNLSLRSLYNGYTPCLFREVPGFGLYFSSYNFMKQRFNQEDSSFKTMLCGGFSGVFAWIFIYPADVVKTRLQSDTLKYPNVIECIRHTRSTLGISVFYKGVSLALLRAFQLHSGVWLGFELCQQFFREKMSK